jgi:hypothetical protein
MDTKAENTPPTGERESFTELLVRLANDSAAVVQDEIELVFRRFRQYVKDVRRSVFTVATGAAILFAAFLSLCAALIIGLCSYMAPVLAALVTGAGLALIGVVIASIGFRKLTKSGYKALNVSQTRNRRISNG